MPSTLQYPLERQRDLQRRWARLLQRTVAPERDQSPMSIPTDCVDTQQTEGGRVPTKTDQCAPEEC